MVDPLNQLGTVGDGVIGNGQDDRSIIVKESDDQELGHHWSDLLRRKIDNADDLSTDKMLMRIVRRDLGACSFDTDVGAEVDGNFVGGLTSFSEILDRGDGTRSKVHVFELFPSDYARLIHLICSINRSKTSSTRRSRVSGSLAESTR